MAKVYDVPADIFISRLAAALKSENIGKPDWASYVKTGSHAVRPPQDRDWWYTRCASVFRKIYLHGPIGVNDMRIDYGGNKAVDRKSTRLNSSHPSRSRMPSSA